MNFISPLSKIFKEVDGSIYENLPVNLDTVEKAYSTTSVDNRKVTTYVLIFDHASGRQTIWKYDASSNMGKDKSAFEAKIR